MNCICDPIFNSNKMSNDFYHTYIDLGALGGINTSACMYGCTFEKTGAYLKIKTAIISDDYNETYSDGKGIKIKYCPFCGREFRRD